MTAKNRDYSNQDAQDAASNVPTTNQDSGVTDQVQQSASAVGDQTKRAASQVKDQATSAATSQLATRKDQTAHGLNAFSAAMQDMGDRLRQNQQTSSFAQYADQAANQIQKVADYLQSRDIGQIADEARDWARRDPVLVLGGAFVLGLVAARFLKASGVQPRSISSGQRGYSSSYRYNNQYYQNYQDPRHGTTYRPTGRYWNEEMNRGNEFHLSDADREKSRY